VAHNIIIEKLDETHIRVLSEDSIERELVDFFTYEYPGARFTPQFRARIWDGKVRLYDLFRKTLYAGLLSYVEMFANERGYNIENRIPSVKIPITINQISEYTKSLLLSNATKDLEIRDYQINAIHNAISETRTLLLSPTASGKSLIIYSIMRWHLENKRKCIIVVPTTNLVEQLYTDFIDYSRVNGWDVQNNCQKLYSGFSKTFEKNVLITTWQSIYRLPASYFNSFSVFFGDEAHQFKARSLISILEKCKNLPYRIGTTGTIDNRKVHKLVLEGLFGTLYKVTSTSRLMETNKLAKLSITCLLLKYDEITCLGRKNNIFSDEMDFLVTFEKRNKFICDLALKTKGNTLILYQFVQKHGIPLYEYLNKKEKEFNKKVYFVSGNTIVSDREAIREFANDTNDCIIVASYGTFSTGINIPSIENIIFASPSKSKIRNLQSIGRGLRLKEGKTICNLYDIADDLSVKKWKNHTLKHFFERIRQYSEEKFDFKIVEVKINADTKTTIDQ
jgi:superfamily II DNA or RNA helicase